MKVTGGGFDQCYNAQALVDMDSMVTMTPHVTQAVNDKQQVAPILDQVAATEGLEHDRYYDLSLAFHDRLLEYCNNQHAALAYEGYVNELHFFRRGLFNYSSEMGKSNE